MDLRTTPAFSSLEAVQFGWTKAFENPMPLMLVGAAAVLLALAQQTIGGMESTTLRPLLQACAQLLQLVVTMVCIRVALGVHDGDPVDIRRGAEFFQDSLSFLLTCALYGLIVAVGFALFVIPGIVWGLTFSMATVAVVDKHLRPIAALRESARLTRGARWSLLGFALLCGGVNALGAITFGVGLLVTVPTTFVAWAYVWRRLEAQVGPAARGMELARTDEQGDAQPRTSL